MQLHATSSSTGACGPERARGALARLVAFVAFAGSFFAASAQTFVEPGEADLRAAYCVEVVTQEVGALFTVPMPDQNTRVLMSEEIARGQVTIERLRAYLASRDPDLSKAALVAAVAQAQSDKLAQRRVFEDCTNRCGATVRGCVQRCVDGDENFHRLAARFRACRDPGWLPR